VRVIVEGFVDFDYEITLLTLRSKVAAGPNSSQSDQQAEVSTTFCPPIGHVQLDGDYRESWSPAEMSPAALAKAQALAQKVTTALGGLGLFGVELFVKSDEVIFSEVSPRPHDTGMVTMVGQDVSEFGLHARAVLGLPVETPNPVGGAGQEYSASHALVVTGRGIPVFHGVDQALAVPTAQVRLFGKPYVNGTRRVGVTLARGATVAQARARAAAAASALQISLV
jgi:phosphoribosylglycinamide formyltransferase 2